MSTNETSSINRAAIRLSPIQLSSPPGSRPPSSQSKQVPSRPSSAADSKPGDSFSRNSQVAPLDERPLSPFKQPLLEKWLEALNNENSNETNKVSCLLDPNTTSSLQGQ
jgi:hypothetical protein